MTSIVSPARANESSENQRSSTASTNSQAVTPNEKEDEWLLSCRCESARSVGTLLQSLESVTKNRKAIQPVTVFCSPSNLTFHVQGPAKQLQASIDMQSTMFSEYRVSSIDDPSDYATEDWQAGGEFSINLTTILECFQILGNTTTAQLSMSYNLTHEIFKIEMLHHSVLCTAAVPGLDLPADHTNPSLVKAFGDSPMATRVILVSSSLQQIVTELQLVPGATVATVSLTEREGLVIAAVGHVGECLLSVPGRGSHIISLEIQDARPRSHSYPLPSLLASLRGLEIARETCITINAVGMIAIQHQVLDPSVGERNSSFIDFIFCRLHEDNEEESETASRVAASQMSDSQSQVFIQTQDDDRTVESVTFHSHPVRQGKEAASLSVASTVSRKSIRSASHVADHSSTVSSNTDNKIPTPPPPTRREWWDASDDEEDEEAHRGSRHSLFGRPRQRIRTSPPSRRPRASDLSTTSPSLLDSATPLRGTNDDSDDDEVDMLDVTAAASPIRNNRDEECSSPELVYGKR